MEEWRKPKSPEDKSTGAPADPSFSSEPAFERRGLAREFWDYLWENKVWWMAPILIMVLLLAALLIFGSSAVAPFIYPFF